MAGDGVHFSPQVPLISKGNVKGKISVFVLWGPAALSMASFFLLNILTSNYLSVSMASSAWPSLVAACSVSKWPKEPGLSGRAAAALGCGACAVFWKWLRSSATQQQFLYGW